MVVLPPRPLLAKRQLECGGLISAADFRQFSVADPATARFRIHAARRASLHVTHRAIWRVSSRATGCRIRPRFRSRCASGATLWWTGGSPTEVRAEVDPGAMSANGTQVGRRAHRSRSMWVSTPLPYSWSRSRPTRLNSGSVLAELRDHLGGTRGRQEPSPTSTRLPRRPGPTQGSRRDRTDSGSPPGRRARLCGSEMGPMKSSTRDSWIGDPIC